MNSERSSGTLQYSKQRPLYFIIPHIKWWMGGHSVSHTSRWPFPHDILFYNDRERCCLQSDGEPKCYNQVCWSYINISSIFPAFYGNLSRFFSYNSSVRAYNILVHGRYLDNDTLFHLVPI